MHLVFMRKFRSFWVSTNKFLDIFHVFIYYENNFYNIHFQTINTMDNFSVLTNMYD